MVRAAIVGLGWWGKHIVRRMQDSPKLEIIAALETSEAEKPFAEEHGIRFTMDWNAILDDPTIDAVILCTPHSLHTQQVLAAAAAGKHVFCEKPLALTRADAERSVDACRASNVMLGIGHERRFEPATVELRRMVREGVLGTIMHVEANFSHDKLANVPEGDWRASPVDAPAAGMTAMGIHLTDLYLDLFGPISEVYAQTAQRVSKRPNGDVVSVQMRFASGATGYINAILVTPLYIGMTVFGSEAWVEIRNHTHPDTPGLTTLTYQSRNGTRDVTEFSWEDAVRTNLEAFADSITGDAEYPFTDAQKIGNIAVLEAICQSVGHNMPVRIDHKTETPARPIFDDCEGSPAFMKQVEVAVIGAGSVGGIRAETLARSALVDKLHICEIRPERLAEVKALTNPATATLDYQDIIQNDKISVVFVSTTPEHTHFPIARDCLRAGKHVMLEKPIALELWEADELIATARRSGVKFTIGYSQRFNPKIAYAKKKIADGTLGKVVNVMVSRHLSRNLGKKIASRGKLSPAAMESTHDLDFVFWLLEPAKPVRIYSQGSYGFMEPINGSYDCMWTTVTMDNGMLVVIGGGWNLPPSYPNFCSTWIEITGTEGALVLDDTHRDNWLTTVGEGIQYPMSTMPGEQVDHVFAGQMGPETIHFLESILLDRPVMVAPEHARMVMETYTAADLSAETNEPIDLPLSNSAISAIADMRGGNLEKVG